MHKKTLMVTLSGCVLWLIVFLVYFNGLGPVSFKFYVSELNSGDLTDNSSSRQEEPESTSDESETLPVPGACPETSPHLKGPFSVEFSKLPTPASIREDNPDLLDGGHFKPPDCVARSKVAVIIPFRNRTLHLRYWLHYLHPVLQRQQLDYGIYVINQHGQGMFNRAMLMNVGCAEALKEYDYDCFVFSDVDLIPMDDRNIYRCFSQPRHLSVAVDKFGFKLPYQTIFGGVTALTKTQYFKINGFPNQYWGWGGEDDDVYKRIRLHGMSISRPDQRVGRYRMIRHRADLKNEPNAKRFDLLAKTSEHMNSDGVNTLKYSVVNKEKDKLYTFITVDLHGPS